eukprot:m.467719 g.467719  ORF g.467719 m.467719 type:complete len:129 (-) comp21642_c1_seq14:1233-1619(-)
MQQKTESLLCLKCNSIALSGVKDLTESGEYPATLCTNWNIFATSDGFSLSTFILLYSSPNALSASFRFRCSFLVSATGIREDLCLIMVRSLDSAGAACRCEGNVLAVSDEAAQVGKLDEAAALDPSTH